MSDLKPCPFCGASNEKHNNIVKLYDDEYYAYEYCNACGARVYANWNTRPIEDALRKEIFQLKKYKLELNAQCFHKDETILVLKNRITELEFDNRSLVEKMNQMVHIGTN